MSQVATTDAEIVLAAVAGTPAACLWCLGDPHQAQAVRAGGLGAELARLGQEGWIPVPALIENRRQLEQGERQALAHYRAGLVATSQALRNAHGWEHDLGSPHATREALADAVVADIASHGPAGVVALAVSHADCEDLADRIRTRLRTGGHLRGPELSGPAWGSGERRYAAGDRILVHGTLRVDGQRLHNGSVLTVTAVTEAGLHTVIDHGTGVVLPRAFVEGHRSDGSPNCSHAWARTVDGIQGGTWPQVHLLGTAALERFTGYTAQSRGRHATHTWNVTRLPELDHGGVLAEQRTPGQEVLDALRRQPDNGFAVHDDPGHIARLLAERTEHQSILAGRPPERRGLLLRAERELESARRNHKDAVWRLERAQHELSQLRGLAGLRPRGRHEKAALAERIDGIQHDVADAAGKVARCEQNRRGCLEEIGADVAWEVAQGWRSQRLEAVETELAEHGITLESGSRREGADHTRLDALLYRHEPFPDISLPPLPGRDVGTGMDIGP